jgi:hypothetical protein
MKMRYILLAALTLSAVTAHAQGDVWAEADHEDIDTVVQIGRWSCDWPGGITGGTSDGQCEAVKFERPFGAAPKIAVSLSAVPFPPSAMPGSGTGYISITASNITKDGFSPVLTAGILPQSRVEGSWIAVGR